MVRWSLGQACLSQALRECGEVVWSAKRHAIGKISYTECRVEPAQACDRPLPLLQPPPSALFAAPTRNNSVNLIRRQALP
jgi:hypothetical protein